MSPTPQDLDALDPRINRALQDFLERIDRGEVVDQEQFLSQHREIADQLRSFITDAVDLARRVKPDANPAAEVSTNRSLSETIPPTAPGAGPALPEVFGRYRVIRLLGRGAMGAVYLADDTQLARQVALKIPHFDTTQPEELLQRFYREARTAATLRNPHICPVYDVGEIGGQHYISMAYIEGHPLSDIIKAKGPQPERQVLTLIRKLALALQDAHNQGVIHRDLKPGNVMVDARGEPVVMDFGLACQVRDGAERLTHSGVILGSPAYMSPEQLEGNSTKVTPAADQYALGVILYELLTGQLPFRGTISAVVGQIITKPAPAPRLLRPELDPRVNDLCLQMLAKTPAERLGSMKAVAERILAIMKEPAKVESPAKTPATVVVPEPRSAASDPATETMAPTGATPQQQVGLLIKQGELQAALEVLEPLAQRKSGKLADWAKQKQAEVRRLLESGQQDQAALCLLAGKLIRKSDYAEAIRILSAIPASARTEELSDLLRDAESKEEEAALLMQDIETAVRKDQPKELPALVKRFLQLKPGNKAIRALAEDLKRYGAEKVIRFRRNQRDFLDPAGTTWNPMHAVYFIGGLSLVCAAVYLAVIAFQTPNGTVIIEVHDPRVVVNFANEEITATSSGKTYRLKTTETKTLQLEVDGATVDASTQQITVARNETKIITARLVDGKLDLAINREKRTFAVPDAVLTEQDADSGANDSAERVGEWIDLVAAADLENMKASNHVWTRNGSVLTSKLLPPSTYAWMAFIPTQEIKGDYDLEIDYLVVGTQHLQVGLPLNETIVTLGLGGRGTGLDWIDGRTAEAEENNVAPHGNPNVQIKTGVIQHLTASVRHSGDNVSVVTKLDDVETGRFSGLRSRIATPEITSPRPGKIKLVTPIRGDSPDLRLEIHKARVRFVTPGSPNPNLSKRVVGGRTETVTDWIDMLNPLDLGSITNSNNRLTREDTHVRGTLRDSVSNGWVIFAPPTELKGDYDLEFDYQVVGCAFIKVGLPLEDCAAGVAIGQGGTRLDGLDGPKINDVLLPPLGNPDMPMKQGVVQRLTVSVRNQAENVTLVTKLDGIEVGRYSGPRLPFQKLTNPLTRLNNLKIASQFVSRTPDHRIEFHKARVRFVTSVRSSDEDWTPLFNGKDFASWKPDDNAWQVKDGVIEITPDRIKRNTYLWSSEEYSDFELRLQYRFLNEAYVGLGMRYSLASDLTNVGPLLQLGYFQPKGGELKNVSGGLFTLLDRKPTDLVVAPDELRAKLEPQVRKGEWIDVYVRCEGPRIITELNGLRTVDYTDVKKQLPRSGKLALYAPQYNKAAGEFRGIRIRRLDQPVSSPKPPQIATDATVFSGHSYKFYPQPISWTEAKQRCEEMGGHLPIVESQAENDFLQQFGKARIPTAATPGIASTWLGATDAAKEGDWRWVDGSPLSFQKWGSQQPNNKQGREHYGLMYLGDGGAIAIKTGEWSDQPDQSVECAAYFICEWDSVLPTTPTSPPASPVVADSNNSTKASTVLLDADFRKGPMDFAQGDYDFLLAQHKDGEYRYMGKKPGWWFGSLHSEFWKPQNNQLRDFVIELDVRIATPKRGMFGVEFGRIGDAPVTLGLNQLGQLSLFRGSDQELVPWTTSRDMRPASQFNTVRLEVQNKVAKVTVNGKPLFEKPLERYSGAGVSLWVNPEEPPFDVRLQRVRLERLGPDETALRDREIRRFKGHTGIIRGVAFLPDGQRAVSVGHEKAFKLWDVSTGKLLHDFTGHPDNVTSVSVSGDGRRALTGCWDHQVRLWDLEERKLLKTLKGHTDVVGSVQLSRDGLAGLSVSNDGVIRRWDLKSGKSTVVPGPAPWGTIALNPAENVIVSGNGDGTVVLRGQQGIAPLIGHGNGYVEGLAFTPDGSKLVTGADDGTVRVWDLNTGKELHRFITDGAGFDTVAVTNDGRYVLAGSSDHTIVSWDILTGDKVATIHADSPVTHRFAISPDNLTVFSGGGDIGWRRRDDYDLRLWKLPSPPAP